MAKARIQKEKANKPLTKVKGSLRRKVWKERAKVATKEKASLVVFPMTLVGIAARLDTGRKTAESWNEIKVNRFDKLVQQRRQFHPLQAAVWVAVQLLIQQVLRLRPCRQVHNMVLRLAQMCVGLHSTHHALKSWTNWKISPFFMTVAVISTTFAWFQPTNHSTNFSTTYTTVFALVGTMLRLCRISTWVTVIWTLPGRFQLRMIARHLDRSARHLNVTAMHLSVTARCFQLKMVARCLNSSARCLNRSARLLHVKVSASHLNGIAKHWNVTARRFQLKMVASHLNRVARHLNVTARGFQLKTIARCLNRVARYLSVTARCFHLKMIATCLNKSARCFHLQMSANRLKHAHMSVLLQQNRWRLSWIQVQMSVRCHWGLAPSASHVLSLEVEPLLMHKVASWM